MKKISISLLVFLLNFYTFGQNFSIGPIVGLNIANLSGDIENNSFKVGFAGGAFANYSITNEFGLTGQLLYSQQGANIEFGNVEDKIRLDYLQVPVLGAYYFGKDKFRPKVLLGPQFGFLLSAKDKDGNDFDSNGQIFETSDISIVAGAGFNYNLAPKIWLNADVRYNFGTSNISKISGEELRNQHFAVMVGVSIGFRDYDEKTGSFSKSTNKKK
ncbi:MAG: porin family protein [Raineya sp.]